MREDYSPFTLGERFTITPPNTRPASDRKRLTLVMERGAFGSGEHETTRSCIELLEGLPDLDPLKALDLGSGTGILTIAALLLNRDGHSLCVDIDPVAVDSCRRNCRINGVEQRVQNVCGTLDTIAEQGFNLVLANIYGDILLDVAELLVDKTRKHGYLLLSGILWEYNFEVKQKYRKLGCRLEKSLLMDEFCTLLFQKE